MFRLPISIVLMFSLSASYICLATDNANGTTIVEMQLMANNSSVKDDGHLGSLVHSTKNQNDTTTATSSPSPTGDKLVPSGDKLRKKNKMQKEGCSYVKEQKDMNDCVVTPHDDDDVPTQTPNLKVTESPVLTTTGNEENTFQPAKIFPDDKDVKTLQNVDKSIAEQLNRTVYETYPETVNPTSIHTTDVTEILHANTKLHINHTELLTNSTSSLLVHDIKELDGISKTETSNDESTTKNMPSGIIALVTAITFAIVVIVAYISLIAWRRYVEYKYGHRELLVNDLEFDTNDLRHFEL